MTNLIYPSIPDPTNSPESIVTAVRALKQAVEQLTGQRDNGPAAHVFVQKSTPPVAIGIGDLWIDPTSKSPIRHWNGTEWVLTSGLTYP